MPATPTYSPPTSQNPMEILRADTRDTRRPMNPLTGICPTHRTSQGYRHASPHGDRLPSENEGYHPDVPQPTANYSLLTANLSFTFSAKEKDVETGLSYFGSRYYSSDLSIWLSVDPMSDKYASLSPYTYCADNPVKLVDPDGEDWFENELTGDVYYSRDYRKGDEKELKGEGWKWMGENNMFGQSADDAITANLDKADVYIQDDSYCRVGFSGNNAKEFMSNMGYKEVPTQVVTYDNTYSYSMSDGKHLFRFTLGGQYDYTETSTYVPNNYSESHRRQIGYSTFGSRDPMSGQMPQVSRYALSYSKSRDFPGVRKLLCALAGRHDYTDHFNCGRLSSAKLSGAQGYLIRKFLSQH